MPDPTQPIPTLAGVPDLGAIAAQDSAEQQADELFRAALHQRVEHNLTLHTPAHQDIGVVLGILRSTFKSISHVCVEVIPASDELIRVTTLLEDALQQAIAAIVRNQDDALRLAAAARKAGVLPENDEPSPADAWALDGVVIIESRAPTADKPARVVSQVGAGVTFPPGWKVVGNIPGPTVYECDAGTWDVPEGHWLIIADLSD